MHEYHHATIPSESWQYAKMVEQGWRTVSIFTGDDGLKYRRMVRCPHETPCRLCCPIVRRQGTGWVELAPAQRGYRLALSGTHYLIFERADYANAREWRRDIAEHSRAGVVPCPADCDCAPYSEASK
jgi:hypothetical protein